MNNPWRDVPLEVYEGHMKLESIAQLQALNEIMSEQIASCRGEILMILGIAGGNGLEYIEGSNCNKVYGVDINKEYLDECVTRYGGIGGRFDPICVDLMEEGVELPKADRVIANLLIEYIGYDKFVAVLKRVKPQYVSCVIQINPSEGFVSDSPYMEQLNTLQAVHHQINEAELGERMKQPGYTYIYGKDTKMANGKILRRIDYIKE